MFRLNSISLVNPTTLRERGHTRHLNKKILKFFQKFIPKAFIDQYTLLYGMPCLTLFVH